MQENKKTNVLRLGHENVRHQEVGDQQAKVAIVLEDTAKVAVPENIEATVNLDVGNVPDQEVSVQVQKIEMWNTVGTNTANPENAREVQL